MLKKVYACLLGEWKCLNDDPNLRISDHKDAYLWWEEGAPIYAPMTPNPKLEHSFYGLNYVKIYYMGKEYRINPVFIQVVVE